MSSDELQGSLNGSFERRLSANDINPFKAYAEITGMTQEQDDVLHAEALYQEILIVYKKMFPHREIAKSSNSTNQSGSVYLDAHSLLEPCIQGILRERYQIWKKYEAIGTTNSLSKIRTLDAALNKLVDAVATHGYSRTQNNLLEYIKNELAPHKHDIAYIKEINHKLSLMSYQGAFKPDADLSIFSESEQSLSNAIRVARDKLHHYRGYGFLSGRSTEKVRVTLRLEIALRALESGTHSVVDVIQKIDATSLEVATLDQAHDEAASKSLFSRFRSYQNTKGSKLQHCLAQIRAQLVAVALPQRQLVTPELLQIKNFLTILHSKSNLSLSKGKSRLLFSTHNATIDRLAQDKYLQQLITNITDDDLTVASYYNVQRIYERLTSYVRELNKADNLTSSQESFKYYLIEVQQRVKTFLEVQQDAELIQGKNVNNKVATSELISLRNHINQSVNQLVLNPAFRAKSIKFTQYDNFNLGDKDSPLFHLRKYALYEMIQCAKTVYGKDTDIRVAHANLTKTGKNDVLNVILKINNVYVKVALISAPNGRFNCLLPSSIGELGNFDDIMARFPKSNKKAQEELTKVRNSILAYETATELRSEQIQELFNLCFKLKDPQLIAYIDNKPSLFEKLSANISPWFLQHLLIASIGEPQGQQIKAAILGNEKLLTKLKLALPNISADNLAALLMAESLKSLHTSIAEVMAEKPDLVGKLFNLKDKDQQIACLESLLSVNDPLIPGLINIILRNYPISETITEKEIANIKALLFKANLSEKLSFRQRLIDRGLFDTWKTSLGEAASLLKPSTEKLSSQSPTSPPASKYRRGSVVDTPYSSVVDKPYSLETPFSPGAGRSKSTVNTFSFYDHSNPRKAVDLGQTPDSDKAGNFKNN